MSSPECLFFFLSGGIDTGGEEMRDEMIEESVTVLLEEVSALPPSPENLNVQRVLTPQACCLSQAATCSCFYPCTAWAGKARQRQKERAMPHLSLS